MYYSKPNEKLRSTPFFREAQGVIEGAFRGPLWISGAIPDWTGIPSKRLNFDGHWQEGK
ncbi:hypothetical protein Nhal_0648 [Nitrosococcus halophilus Nc 4]|uniref:Uncharacterized protein n=1 Tax=Nitrosococcus halophilus (strain Nc4) TaxID=472759 RepID=D5BWU7_NITHN|nr:hypothetical protein Nhal_0648 [Nitrosococcus halophilus Nc 4]